MLSHQMPDSEPRIPTNQPETSLEGMCILGVVATNLHPNGRSTDMAREALADLMRPDVHYRVDALSALKTEEDIVKAGVYLYITNRGLDSRASTDGPLPEGAALDVIAFINRAAKVSGLSRRKLMHQSAIQLEEAATFYMDTRTADYTRRVADTIHREWNYETRKRVLAAGAIFLGAGFAIQRFRRR